MVEVYYRMAVCEFSFGRSNEGRQRLLQASVLALQEGSVDVSLALDCARILKKHPSKAVGILLACRARTPEVMLELCRCYIALRATMRLCQTSA